MYKGHRAAALPLERPAFAGMSRHKRSGALKASLPPRLAQGTRARSISMQRDDRDDELQHEHRQHRRGELRRLHDGHDALVKRGRLIRVELEVRRVLRERRHPPLLRGRVVRHLLRRLVRIHQVVAVVHVCGRVHRNDLGGRHASYTRENGVLRTEVDEVRKG